MQNFELQVQSQILPGEAAQAECLFVATLQDPSKEASHLFQTVRMLGAVLQERLMRMCMHACMHACMYLYRRTYASMYACLHRCTKAYMRTYVRT